MGLRLASLKNKIEPMQQKTVSFKGLNLKPVIEDGEMRDMQNLSSDEYPCVAQRTAREKLATGTPYAHPVAIDARHEKLIVINRETVDGQELYKVYYDGVYTGATVSSADVEIVSINTKICFFPDRKYYDTTNGYVGEFASCNTFVTNPETLAPVSFTVTNGSNAASADYATLTLTRPGDELSLASVVDTSSGYPCVRGLKEGDVVDIKPTGILSASGISIPLTWTEDTVQGAACIVSQSFSIAKNKPVTIPVSFTAPQGRTFASSTAATTAAVRAIIYAGSTEFVDASFNFTKATGTGTITFTLTDRETAVVRLAIAKTTALETSITVVDPDTGASTIQYESFVATKDNTSAMIQSTLTDASAIGALTISARVEAVTKTTIFLPKGTYAFLDGTGTASSDITCESLVVERKAPNLACVIESNNRLWGACDDDNTIYASKLGDPTNWGYYQNTSLDGYYAEQGTDGRWTGCAAYSTHLLFFKENFIHKVYGSKPSEYQIVTSKGYGMATGCKKSVAILNDVVIYKSPIGFMAYDSGMPVLISDCFDKSEYSTVVAGTDGVKYYASALNADTLAYEFLVYDISKNMWYREDQLHVIDCCFFGNKLQCVSGDEIYTINTGREEPGILWRAVFGPFDEYVEDKKIYSRIKLNVTLNAGSRLSVLIMTDDGSWETCKIINAPDTQDIEIPIVPRRCSKFSIALEGMGACRIKSMTRLFRQSTMRKDASA